jgi:hypothetical protein
MLRALPPVLSFLIAAAVVACGGSHPTPTESDMDTCSNGRDDDDDGLVDCHDPACSIFSFCNAHDGGPTDAAIDAPTIDANDDASVDVGPPVDAGSCNRPLDVVLVVDVSTSMAGELATIGGGVDALWSTAHALSSDAQIMLVVFVDDALAVDGRPPFAADGGCHPFATPDDLRTQLAAWQMFCATNESPVSHLQNHDCPENSLDAIMAGTMCPLRDGSTRVMIHVTDDTFAERPAVLSGEWGGGVHVQFNYLEATTALTDRGIHFGVFAETGTGDDCGAGRSPDVGRGFSGPYQMMPSLPDATGGRYWDLREVRAGHIDMAASITDFLGSVYCPSP